MTFNHLYSTNKCEFSNEFKSEFITNQEPNTKSEIEHVSLGFTENVSNSKEKIEINHKIDKYLKDKV